MSLGQTVGPRAGSPQFPLVSLLASACISINVSVSVAIAVAVSVSVYSSFRAWAPYANFHHMCLAEFSFDIDFMFIDIDDNSLWGFVYLVFLFFFVYCIAV